MSGLVYAEMANYEGGQPAVMPHTCPMVQEVTTHVGEVIAANVCCWREDAARAPHACPYLLYAARHGDYTKRVELPALVAEMRRASRRTGSLLIGCQAARRNVPPGA